MGRTDKLAVAAASRRGDRWAPEVGSSDGARELEALRNRVLELEELFDDASTGLVRTTRAGRVLQANRALLEILECRRERCVGHDWASFHSDRGSVGDLIERLTRRETLRNHPAALRARGGRLKEVLVDASALWQRGRIVHIRWFVRDITRRKQLEREVLATSERERRSFARELHDSLGQQLSGIAYLGGVLHAPASRTRVAGGRRCAADRPAASESPSRKPAGCRADCLPSTRNRRDWTWR